MTVEKYQVRRGAFLHHRIKGSAQDINSKEFLDCLKAASPRGRIEVWKGHAERLGVGLGYLAEAESLIDEHGIVKNLDRFDWCMVGAIADIEAAQNEITFVPLAIEGVKRAKYLHAPKQKKDKRLLTIIRELEPQYTSAQHLLDHFPERKVDGWKYRKVEGDGVSYILRISPAGERQSFGLRALSNYWKDVKK
jgi:hypothetical protein